MIRAVHIEDEPRNIELLESLLKMHFSETIILDGSARSISDAVALIKNKKPQLVYLDIELNQGNAFELLEQINDFTFEVIFITAYNEYAVKAFRINAVDYLLKPISILELKEATAKAIHKINNSLSGNENLRNVIKQFKTEIGAKKIGIPVSDGLLFINSEDITHIGAKGSYSIMYLSNGKHITCTKNLKSIEHILPDNLFLRVHHSWMVNLKYLKKYFRGKNGYIEMENGTTVPVSIRKKGRFLHFLPD